jgi:hypothetical protein
MAETIVIGTKVDLNGLKKGEKDIKKSVSDMGDSFGSKIGSIDAFGASITSLSGGVAVAIGAITGLTIAVSKYTSSQVEMAREIARVADNANIANEAVSGIASTFLSAGGDIDMAGDFVQDFTERLGDAKAGSGSLQEAFNELGVNINGTTEQALQQTISTLGTMEDRQRALFRGIELFGDTYKTVAQDIDRGTDIMQNGLFGNEFINNSERLVNAFADIKQEFQATSNDAIEPLVETLADLSEQFLDNGGIELFTDYLRDVGTVAGFVLEKIVELDTAFNGLFGIEPDKTRLELAEQELDAREQIVANIKAGNSAARRALTTQELEPLRIAQEQVEAQKELIRLMKGGQRAQNESIRSAVTGSGDSVWDPSRLENAMIDSMDRIREQARANRLQREQDARDEALILLGIERESHQNRKAQRTDARNIELENAEALAGEKKRLAEQGAQFAFDIGNTFFEMSLSRDQRELDQWKRTQDAKNNSLIVTSRRRRQIEEQTSKETEQREAEFAKKRGAMQIAMGWADAGRGIIGTWSQALSSAPPAFAVPSAIATSAMMTGIATANTAMISNSMQSFANGGIVKQEAGLPSTGDKHVVAVNPNEEILTEDDPRHANNISSGGGIRVHIENFSGNDDDMDRLEQTLLKLQSAGRTSMDLVS